jgi:hypothetical protein
MPILRSGTLLRRAQPQNLRKPKPRQVIKSATLFRRGKFGLEADFRAFDCGPLRLAEVQRL